LCIGNKISDFSLGLVAGILIGIMILYFVISGLVGWITKAELTPRSDNRINQTK